MLPLLREDRWGPNRATMVVTKNFRHRPRIATPIHPEPKEADAFGRHSHITLAEREIMYLLRTSSTNGRRVDVDFAARFRLFSVAAYGGGTGCLV